MAETMAMIEIIASESRLAQRKCLDNELPELLGTELLPSMLPDLAMGKIAPGSTKEEQETLHETPLVQETPPGARNENLLVKAPPGQPALRVKAAPNLANLL